MGHPLQAAKLILAPACSSKFKTSIYVPKPTCLNKCCKLSLSERSEVLVNVKIQQATYCFDFTFGST